MISQNLTFTVQNLQDRLDVSFYDPELIKFETWLDSQKNSVPITEFCTVTDGSHEVREYVDEGIPFLRITNIREDGINLDEDNLVFISKREHFEELFRSNLIEGDVLFTKTGTLGLTFVVPKDFGEANISADLALFRISSDKKNDLLPEYLSMFLKSEFFMKQVYKNLSGSSRDRIVLSNLKKLKIIKPSIEIQNDIVKEINLLKAGAKKHLSNFNEFTEKLKGSLSNIISYNIHNKTNVFIVGSERVNDRLDCLFNSPDYSRLQKELESNKYKDFSLIHAKTLDINTPMKRNEVTENEILSFKYLDIGNTDKNLDTIKSYEEDLLINLPSRARQVTRTNDVLVPRPIGSTNTIITIPKDFNAQLYSTGFIGIHTNNYEDALILQTVLKSDIVQMQFKYLQSGSLQPEITPENFKDYIILPLPNNTIKSNFIENIKKLKDDSLNEFKQYLEIKQQIDFKFVSTLNEVSI
jgi:type I restriction enzyme S subunit